uniref:Uncharacterized protein n=1 Tax=Chromera velia CCMP2878 TaxID=1169474 RepID=A0A0G4HXC6_9ALVE|eukprot:Cvel_9227.t1-p1 / transcript=Cvel_9227.t1 / gene=Cvel_9227 / organism=Chromera_velia_CCMP2878 / gene_product=Ankyrin-2, putative / transcript_product=Ankyrin-2, putative / location=Cvel_scaffold526:48483-56370(-) / protein_length=1274 / sequence_SO=supercontig / SO=protein_coding / is_pseudo=false
MTTNTNGRSGRSRGVAPTLPGDAPQPSPPSLAPPQASSIARVRGGRKNAMATPGDDINQRLLRAIQENNLEGARRAILEGADLNTPIAHSMPILPREETSLRHRRMERRHSTWNSTLSSSSATVRSSQSPAETAEMVIREVTARERQVVQQHPLARPQLPRYGLDFRLPSRPRQWPQDQISVSARVLDNTPLSLPLHPNDVEGTAPLGLAAQNNFLDMAVLLIEKGARLEAGNRRGETPLFLAAERNHVRMAQLLLEKGADVQARRSDGIAPLEIAVKEDHVEMVKLLTAHGAVVETGTEENAQVGNSSMHTHEVPFSRQGPIFDAEENPLLSLGLRHKSPGSTRHVLEGGASVLQGLAYYNRICPDEKTAALFLGCWTGDTETVRRSLMEGAEIECDDEEGAPPLFTAVAFENAEVVSLLILNGACLESTNKDSDTPLLFAVRRNSVEMARLLIGNGAETEGGLAGKGEDDRAYLRFLGHKSETPLGLAVRRQQVEMVRVLLEGKAEIDSSVEALQPIGPVLKLCKRLRGIHLSASDRLPSKGKVRASLATVQRDVPRIERVNFQLLSTFGTAVAGPKFFSVLLYSAVTVPQIANDLGSPGLRDLFEVILDQAVTLVDPLCFLLEQIQVCKERTRTDHLSDDFERGVERTRSLVLLLLEERGGGLFARRGGDRLLFLTAVNGEKAVAAMPEVRRLLRSASSCVPEAESLPASAGPLKVVFAVLDQGLLLSPSSVRTFFFLSLLTIIVMCFTTGMLPPDPFTSGGLRKSGERVWIPLIVAMYLSVCHLYLECVQLREAVRSRELLRKRVNPWNVFESIVLLVILICPLAALKSDCMAWGLQRTLVMCGFVLCIRSLEFAMTVRFFGPRIFCMVRMFGDILFFALMLGALLFVFAITVFALAQRTPELLHNQETEDFKRLDRTIFALFNCVLKFSQHELSIFDEAEDDKAFVVAGLIILWEILAVVMMLNFLIALMAKSLDRVETDANELVALFRVRLWADIASLPPEVRLPPCVAPFFFWMGWIRPPSRIEEVVGDRQKECKGGGDRDRDKDLAFKREKTKERKRESEGGSREEGTRATRTWTYHLVLYLVNVVICLPLSIVNAFHFHRPNLAAGFLFGWVCFPLCVVRAVRLAFIRDSAEDRSCLMKGSRHFDAERAFMHRNPSWLCSWEENARIEDERARKEEESMAEIFRERCPSKLVSVGEERRVAREDAEDLEASAREALARIRRSDVSAGLLKEALESGVARITQHIDEKLAGVLSEGPQSANRVASR